MRTKRPAIQRRLRRIDGQVRGLQSFVGEDRYRVNLLEQISATTRAIHSVAMKLLTNHPSRCAKESWAGRGSESEVKVKEAQAAIERLVQS
ncbi:MAG: metal-sensitive transcriptional regulator [Acidobacteria bacterium]|nr:metal-sensitive transcriptional regulator [Acidobacteriota bacterium]